MNPINLPLYNSRLRLRQLKAKAKSWNESKRFIHNDYTWRKVRYKNYVDTIVYSDDRKKWFCEKPETIGKNLGDCHELINLHTIGYYCDSYQSGTVKGAVVKMRTCNGIYYIPFTYCTDWDGITAHFSYSVLVPKKSDQDNHDRAIQEAARYADSLAESEAETSREYHAKDQQAERDIELAKDEIKATREHVHKLITELKTINLPPTICDIIKTDIKESMLAVKNNIRLIHKLRDNFWAAVDKLY